jgi:hypothetical protein
MIPMYYIHCTAFSQERKFSESHILRMARIISGSWLSEENLDLNCDVLPISVLLQGHVIRSVAKG